MKNILIVMGMALVFAVIGMVVGPMVMAARERDERISDRRRGNSTSEVEAAMLGVHGLTGGIVGLVVGAGLGMWLATALDKGKRGAKKSPTLVPPPPPPAA